MSGTLVRYTCVRTAVAQGVGVGGWRPRAWLPTAARARRRPAEERVREEGTVEQED